MREVFGSRDIFPAERDSLPGHISLFDGRFEPDDPLFRRISAKNIQAAVAIDIHKSRRFVGDTYRIGDDMFLPFSCLVMWVFKPKSALPGKSTITTSSHPSRLTSMPRFRKSCCTLSAGQKCVTAPVRVSSRMELQTSSNQPRCRAYHPCSGRQPRRLPR